MGHISHLDSIGISFSNRDFFISFSRATAISSGCSRYLLNDKKELEAIT
jgi:hypothetical protein